MLLFLAWATISNDTSPHPRSFDMADHELATLIAKIEKAETRRDKLEALEAAGVAVNQERLAGVQNELSALQVRLNNLMEKQGENLASRSPPHRLSSPHACQRIPEGGLSRTLGNLQRDDQLTGWLQSHALRVPDSSCCA